MEVANAKGSARLLHLSIANSTIMVGEQFNQAELDAALHAGGLLPVLLYPESPGHSAPPAPTRTPEQLRLVILDGTWRKSRKMLHQNPALQTLPRLALDDLPPSHYLIRKAHAGHQLSTLEAACHALGRMHGGGDRCAPLLGAFDDFVATFHATSGNLRNALEVREPPS